MDQLLKSDADRMRDLIKECTNAELELEDRELALDELEMLVESIDNANDFATIKGIAPLLALFDEPEPIIQMNAAWVLGTCAQNNERFTKEFLKENGLDRLVDLLRRTTDNGVRGKAIYAISGCVRASTDATAKAIDLNAFETLIELLRSSSDLNIKRKLAFFFGGVIFEQNVQENLLQHLLDKNLYEVLIDTLKTEDLDLQDKIFEALDAAFATCPKAVSHIKQGILASQLTSWAKSAQLTAEQKTAYSQTLKRIGLQL
jgi:HEAT repeat protein